VDPKRGTAGPTIGNRESRDGKRETGDGRRATGNGQRVTGNGSWSNQAQTVVFLAQLDSLYRCVNAFAVSFNAAASLVALYRETPAQ
jgi:hypothetical protein